MQSDRFAREIVAILAQSRMARSRRLMREALDGTYQLPHYSHLYHCQTRTRLVQNNRESIQMEELPPIPEHHSPVRHLVSETHGIPYQPIHTFDEAKQIEDAVLVMEGDWGGQIYLVCPMRLVGCDETDLHAILKELDTIAWESNDGEGAKIYYERARSGQPIIGGMAGGTVTDDLWLHEEFIKLKIGDKIRQMIMGADE
jgi:hypothetical protein